jgi:membrane protein YdbS with pleckstrin-like domain
MELLVSLLRPLVYPLLKLDERPPHLPEGSSLVRTLRPAPAFLSYRYLVALFGLLNQVVGTGVVMVGLVLRGETPGMVLAVLLAVGQLLTIAVTLVATRVDYELRHYLVGDRSLRVASGAIIRTEVTLSYANVQNVEVRAGPLEQLFGLQSLVLSTAGGDTTPGDADNLHLVTLVGLDDALAIRELVTGMLRKERDAGLGEPRRGGQPAGVDVATLTQVRDAALALRRAARQLDGTGQPG